LIRERQQVFSAGMIATIVACYAASGVILWARVGPWEAVRNSLVNGLLAFAWLALAHRLLSEAPQPGLAAPRRPRLELALLLAALLAMMALAALRYAGWVDVPDAVYYLVSYGTVLAVILGSGYGRRGLGLILPPRRAWAVALGIIVLNVLAGVLFQILPPGEGVTAQGEDLSQQLSRPSLSPPPIAGPSAPCRPARRARPARRPAATPGRIRARRLGHHPAGPFVQRWPSAPATAGV
jgi:hypothetical protein